MEVGETVYSIKVDANEVPAKALMAIKKLTGLPLGAVKEAVAGGSPIFGCGCADDEGLLLIAKLHDELAEMAVATVIFWYDSEEPYQNLLNTIEMHREIDEEEFD